MEEKDANNLKMQMDRVKKAYEIFLDTVKDLGKQERKLAQEINQKIDKRGINDTLKRIISIKE